MTTHLQQEEQALNWLETVGIVAIIGILISGMLTYTSDSDQVRSISYWGLYALLGGSLLVGFLKWETYHNMFVNIVALVSLTSLGLVCMLMVNFRGIIWFVLMPIAMQAGLFLPRRQVVIYMVCLVLGMNLLAYSLVFSDFPFSLWLSNTVNIGGLYAVGIVLQIALGEQLQARAEVERLNEQLQDYAIQAAALAAAEERNRMAHTIHDSVGHSLTVVSVQLEAAERLIEHGKLDQATTAICTARRVAREGLNEVRLSVQNLRSDQPPEHIKLSEALQALLSSLHNDERRAGMEVSDATVSIIDTLPQTTQHVLLRAVQEGLTNALKHGNPTQITLTVEQVAQAVKFILSNNQTNAVAGIGNRSGLKTMREQFASMGGHIETQHAAHTFTLLIEVPHGQ